nr:signal peptidase II [Streptomonospora nanhaiensis]
MIVAAAALGADFATKEIALAGFAPGESMPVVDGLLWFTLITNSGAAFSIGSGVPWVFFLIASGVVVYILFMARRLGSLGWTVALGLILGGASGNLVDRVTRPPAPFHGEVVDWIAVPNFPVFNLADSCICVGGALAVLLAFRGINIDGTRESDQARGTEAAGTAEKAAKSEDAEAAEPAAQDRPAEAGGAPAAGADDGPGEAGPAPRGEDGGQRP